MFSQLHDIAKIYHMRILVMTNCPCDPLTGSGKAVIRYTEGLRRKGHDVDLVEPKDFEVFPSLKRARQYRQAIGAWKVATKMVRKTRYDLIELYGGVFGLAARTIAKKVSRPILIAHTNGMELLYSERSLDYAPKQSIKQWASGTVMNFIAKLQFSYTDRFVCMTSSDLQYALAKGFYSEKSSALVPHGTDDVFRTRPFIESKEHRVAYLGHWTMGKGVDILVRVMTEILRNDSAVSLDIVGSGERPELVLQAFPDEVRHQVVVHVANLPGDLADILSRAKVFFFPSQYEGFGFAVTEAMCCSCAVVGTPAGVMSDLVADQEAVVCGYRDEVGMVRAISGLLATDETRRRIAYGGWSRAREMTWDAAVDALERAYSEWVVEWTRGGKTIAATQLEKCI